MMLVFWEIEPPPFFKLENALLVRKQITDGSLQLPLLGAVKKGEKKDSENK